MHALKGLSGLSGKSLGAQLAELSGTDDARTFWGVAAMVSSAACAYHGYKRNDSIGWALVWSFTGFWFVPFTPIIAVAQGFGQRKRG